MKSSSVLKILIFNWVSAATEEQRVTAEHTHTQTHTHTHSHTHSHGQICGTRRFIVCGSVRLSLSLSYAVDSHQLSPSLTTWMLRGRWSCMAWNCTMLGWVTGTSYPAVCPSCFIYTANKHQRLEFVLLFFFCSVLCVFVCFYGFICCHVFVLFGF